MEMSLFSDEQILKAYGNDRERKGKEEGKREEARAVARRLLALGDLPIDKIARSTKLSIEEVSALADKMKTGD